MQRTRAVEATNSRTKNAVLEDFKELMTWPLLNHSLQIWTVSILKLLVRIQETFFPGYSGTVQVGNKITEMAQYGPGYELYFEWFNQYHDEYSWLMVARKDNDPNIGYGAPCIWIRLNWIYTYIRTDPSELYLKTYILAEANKWQSYRLTQYKKGSDVSLIMGNRLRP